MVNNVYKAGGKITNSISTFISNSKQILLDYFILLVETTDKRSKLREKETLCKEPKINILAETFKTKQQA